MDRNSVIGFSLLIVLVVSWVFYNQHEQGKFLEQKRIDSIAYAKAHPQPTIDSSKALKQIAAADSLNDSMRKNMPPAFAGTAQTVKLENKLLSLTFTSKGAYPVSAEIKQYKTYDQKPLYLFNGKGNQLSAVLPVNNGATATADLYFEPVTRNEPNGDKTIDFVADMGGGKKVDIIYTLPADGYMMHCDMRFSGMPASSIPLTWNTAGLHTEKDVMSERMYAQLYYQYKNGDHDYYTMRGDKDKALNDGPTEWVGFRKQYFSSILVNHDGFSKVNIKTTTDTKDSGITAVNNDQLEVATTAGAQEDVKMDWYIGPNDYRILKSYKMGFDEMVPMGSGIMAFVKYVNRWLLIPIFYFLVSIIGNYGVIIMIMTLFIRLILSFFTYKSYLSAAKMRVLKPELDELRAKIGDDQQKFGVEQMKLYKSAGVNPMGGCLPMVFQIPILFALYYMFPSFVEFRQKSFLWAHDLSTYDNVLNLPFNIPFYGNHVSLFTLLMTASSMFLALYNRNMTSQQAVDNPVLKYMPFIYPIFLMGIFNKMAAALTFYYTFSNIISITMQFVIQKYFINEKAIHAQIQENRNKPAVPSKWAQRLEEMQKAQTARGTTIQPRKK